MKYILRPGVPRCPGAVLRCLGVLCSLLVAAALFAGRTAQAQAPGERSAVAPDCDRACLIGFLHGYLDALVHKDPSRSIFARSVHFTENDVEMPLGEGLWGSVSAVAPAGLEVADPSTGNAAWFGTVQEHGNGAFYAMRLKVVQGRITQVETVIQRKPDLPAPFGDPAALRHDPAFNEILPADQRRERERLVAVADGYFNTVEQNDGQIFTAFDADCQRTENGISTTRGAAGAAAIAQGCEQQFKLGLYRINKRVRERLYPIVDAERGVVVATGFFDHANTFDTYRTTDGKLRRTALKWPNSITLMEAFRIRNGAIQRIESVFTYVPYFMHSPWAYPPAAGTAVAGGAGGATAGTVAGTARAGGRVLAAGTQSGEGAAAGAPGAAAQAGTVGTAAAGGAVPTTVLRHAPGTAAPGAPAGAVGASGAACDRDCLFAAANVYMDALVAHDPARVPWARTVRYTENSVAMMIGDGEWGVATGHGADPQLAADPATGNVAWFGTVQEHGQPSFYAMRLKVENHRVAEVEAVLDRKGEPGAFGDPTAYHHDPEFSRALAPRERSSRQKMIAVVNGYFNTVQRNDGTIRTRFDPDCQRQENGLGTTTSGFSSPARGCEAQFKLGTFKYDDRVRDRRFPLVDAERGIVVAAAYFDHAATFEEYRTTDGKLAHSPFESPNCLGFLEMFKIRNGMIYRIESIYTELPYRMSSQWQPQLQ